MQPQLASSTTGADPLVRLASSSVAAVATSLVSAPLVKVKLALQNQDSTHRVLSGQMKRYRGVTDCFRRHVTELGAASLWRGNLIHIITPSMGFLRRYLVDNVKSAMPHYDKRTQFASFFAVNTAAGAASGGLVLAFTYPLIYARTVFGADCGVTKQFAGLAPCLKQTVKAHGILSLYNGIGATVMSTLVNRGAMFGLHDTLRGFNPYRHDVGAMGLISKFAIAQLAVATAEVVAYPFDTVACRLRIEASKPTEQQMYKSMSDCFGKIRKMEGPRGFFKGLLPHLLNVAVPAVVLVLYDEIATSAVAEEGDQ